MRRHVLPAIALTVVCAIDASVKPKAQTIIVPYNHRASGNFTFRSLDLNTASTNELTKVLGLDVVLARKIIEARPYRTARELIDRQVIPTTTYMRIESRLVVKSLPR
jgi:DNA uptake protein ComE-like DNA-binding protein